MESKAIYGVECLTMFVVLADRGRALTTFTLFYLPINEAGIRGHQRYSRDEVGKMRNRGRTHKLAIRQVNST